MKGEVTGILRLDIEVVVASRWVLRDLYLLIFRIVGRVCGRSLRGRCRVDRIDFRLATSLKLAGGPVSCDTVVYCH